MLQSLLYRQDKLSYGCFVSQYSPVKGQPPDGPWHWKSFSTNYLQNIYFKSTVNNQARKLVYLNISSTRVQTLLSFYTFLPTLNKHCGALLRILLWLKKNKTSGVYFFNICILLKNSYVHQLLPMHLLTPILSFFLIGMQPPLQLRDNLLHNSFPESLQPSTTLRNQSVFYF